jgi:hypothetical protein
MTGRLLVPVDAGGPAEDEALDDRGQLEGRVTLQAVAGFLDVNDLGVGVTPSSAVPAGIPPSGPECLF